MKQTTNSFKLQRAARYILEADAHRSEYNEHRNTVLTFVQDCLEKELNTDYYSNPKPNYTQISTEPLVNYDILDENSVVVTYWQLSPETHFTFYKITKIFFFGETTKPEPQAVLKPYVVSYLTFENVVEYMRYNSKPPHWFCKYKNVTISYENSMLYLINTNKETLRFGINDVLITNAEGNISMLESDTFFKSYDVKTKNNESNS